LSSLLKIPVSLVFIFSTITATGGDPYRQSAGAGEAGMGYACVMKNSFWSYFHNQASLAFNNSLSLGVNYENRFSLEELGIRTAGIIIPVWKTSLGAVYSHFGYPDFNRQMAALACGLKLSDIVSAGVQIDYFSEKASGEFRNYKSITCEAGLIIIPSESIRLGIHIFNPVPASLRNDHLPSILRVGAGTDLSSSLFAGAEAEMSTNSKLIIRTGFEYKAVEKLMLRGGYSTDNNSFSFGLGILTKIVMIDFGFSTHEKLGMTSSCSLIFKIPSIR
jgi:hypothetical protein